jgi:response regulator RpfG family c-di-GMP phosphodiesterase
MLSATWIGDQLLAEGRLSQDQYFELLMRMKRAKLRMEEALLEMRLLDEAALLQFIAKKTRTQYLTASKLAELIISDDALQKLPAQSAEKLCCVPIHYDRDRRELSVVTPDAGDPDHVQQIAVAGAVPSVKAYVARPAAVEAAIRRWYGGQIQAFVDVAVETFIQLHSARDLLRDGQMSKPLGASQPAWPPTAAPRGPEPQTASAALAPPAQPPAPAAVSGGAHGSTAAPAAETPAPLTLEGPAPPLLHAGPDRRISELAEMLHVLVALNENSRDEFRGHSASVARLSRQVVQRMGLGEAAAVHAGMAANLHDLGKPVAYHLTAINILKYATHRGAAQKLYATPVRLLESIELPAEAASAVTGMYERFDGQGFPAALKGKQIPIGARILCLCDAYSDLTLNPRNIHRRILTADEALKALTDFKNSLFDPDLVDILGQVMAGENLLRRLSHDRPVVLLVEPAPEEASVMGLRLMAQGFDVKVARTGEQALQFAESGPVSFVLSEATLQPFDGFELLSRLRKSDATADVPFIFVAQASDTAAIDRAFALGAQDYVVKPTSGDVLAAKLRRIGGPKSRRTTATGIAGALSEMGLPDLSQILSQGKKSGRLTLRHDDEQGEVHFESGDIIHAQFRGKTGQEAFFELLTVEQGSFSLDPSFQPAEHTIKASVESLLLEGIRRLDENRRAGK